MTKDTLQATVDWFQEAIPEPTAKSFNVQLGVHVEEFGEMLDELAPHTRFGHDLIKAANRAVRELAIYLKTTDNGVSVEENRREAFIDSIADQLVTAAGTAYQLGMNSVGALEEVNRSNYSKFVDGKAIFDDNGKIAKGPSYSKADLSSFV